MLLILLCIVGTAIALGYALACCVGVGYVAVRLIIGVRGFIARHTNPVRRRRPRPAAFYQWR